MNGQICSRQIHKHALFIVLALSLALPMAAQTAAPTSKKAVTPPPDVSKQSARQTQAQSSELSRIAIPPLPAFNPQEPKRIVLPNGLVVFLQQDHELPVIGGTLRFRGGSRSEPADKTGLLDIYGMVWRTGGSKARTGDQLDDFLEARAARVESSSAPDSTSLSFNCLKGDFDEVFTVFRELLLQPEFREDKIALSKRQLDGAIARRNDDPDEIAGREMVSLAYGKDNPYARDNEYATVAAVTRQDLIDWHTKYIHPNNAILGIYGDFDAVAMEARIREAFGNWQKGQQAETPKIDFTPAKPGLYFVPKDDIDQSNIQMVTLGIERSNPDFFAVSVMNEVLSGGFSSRLVNNLRSKAGLAYSVSGGVGSSWDHPGISSYSMATKSASTKEAIEGMRKELVNLLNDPPTAAELKRAQDAILNSFVFNFDSKQKVLAEKMRYEFYGVPLDYLERYRSAIEKVTVDDVNRVAHKYVHPDQLAVLVVGNPGELGDQLSSLGQVTPIDISIPPPPGEPAQAGAAQVQKPSR
jgi:zinc protease